MNIKELNEIVEVTDINETGFGKMNEKMPYEYVKIDKSTLPEAEVRQKLAKSRNWQVCKSWLDVDNKCFCYVIAINAESVESRTVTFDEACNDFHWKKFDIVNNNQSLKWYRDDNYNKYVNEAMNRMNEHPVWESKDSGTWKKVCIKTDKEKKNNSI